VTATAGALRAWPASFASRSDARRVLRRAVWSRPRGWGLGERPRAQRDGLAAAIRCGRHAQTLREVSVPSWDEWDTIRCPTLVVRAGNGMIEPETAGEMIERLPRAQLVEIPDAAHDLHLDRPMSGAMRSSASLTRLTARGSSATARAMRRSRLDPAHDSQQ